MKHLMFLLQYIVKPRTTGAVIPSSRYLADKMMNVIHFETANTIVEYGPGTGVFTELLLEKRLPSTKIILIENNERFYNQLRNKFGHLKNVFIVHDSAENINILLKDLGISCADYIVSGLPFASLPKSVSKTILKNTKKVLSNKGKFITFQYTQRKIQFIHAYFNHVNVERELRNLPPAYVLQCNN